MLGGIDLLKWIDLCPLDQERPNPLDPHWRMAGDRWQHYHGYPLGHEDTIKKPLIDWVICGGESGPKARPMQPEWAQRLRDQCQISGVPFYFKQWGEWYPVFQGGKPAMLRLGKKNAGRMLDGRIWDEVPANG
jgi:protein gp37